MNVVEPIRDLNKFNAIKDKLLETNKRDYLMVMMGTYSGLRIGDILKLKVGDVSNKDYLIIKEEKTGKEQKIKLVTKLKEFLKDYCKDKPRDEYLIKSIVGENKPICRERAWQIMKSIGEEFGIERLGTHTLRKTFGYHYYKQTNNIGLLMAMYNHSSEAMTLRYIGITSELIDEARENFDFQHWKIKGKSSQLTPFGNMKLYIKNIAKVLKTLESNSGKKFNRICWEFTISVIYHLLKKQFNLQPIRAYFERKAY